MASVSTDVKKMFGLIRPLQPPPQIKTGLRWREPDDIPTVVDDGAFPPYSFVDLVGMAVIRSANGRLTCKEICKWIFDTFQYFREQSFQGYFNSANSRNLVRKDFDWIYIIKDTLERYDSLVAVEARHTAADEIMYRIRPGLQVKVLRISQPVDETTFPFTKLPPEIRNQLYGLLLVCSSMIISPQSRKPNLSGYKCSRKEFSIESRQGKELGWIPPTVMLSILGVCRQTHREAVGFFYNQNHFNFNTRCGLTSFLRGVGPERRNWIRKMTILFQGNIGLGSSLQPLLQCERLTKVRLVLSRVSWNEEDGGSIQDHKGVEQLGKLKGLTTFTCEPWIKGGPLVQQETEAANQIEQYLRPLVFLPREPKICATAATRNLWTGSRSKKRISK